MTVIKPGQTIQTTGDNPVGIWRPSFTVVKDKLFVIGGGGVGNITNDLRVLSLNDMRWEKIQTVKGTVPGKRYGHTATLWDNFIIVFGGCNEFNEYVNDVYMFDIPKQTWFQPDIKGIVPARYLHSASVYNNKLFIYSGFAKNTEVTYVLDELSVLDLKSFIWSKYHNIPARYNHSATLVGHKMYIYGGKDENGNAISDLYVVVLNTPPYTPDLVLDSCKNMELLKSPHFCEYIHGKLLVFGRYATTNNSNQRFMYGLWKLDLDTLERTREECNAVFDIGVWNYFTTITENTKNNDEQQVSSNNLLFLGNTDSIRPKMYDHFRDALVINSESLGLYDMPSLVQVPCEFSRLSNNSDLSDFVVVSSNSSE
ncbi:hypothetical protein HPULCUR_004493 [Helicostylum pulchrum]|uniref:Galactose oxidase n=1 Tax=Helicostylum pulchrum TaxID=562976 RepID=A0ABP9XWE2_9FUNG